MGPGWKGALAKLRKSDDRRHLTRSLGAPRESAFSVWARSLVCSDLRRGGARGCERRPGRLEEPRQPLAGDGADGVEIDLPAGEGEAEGGQLAAGVGQIELVEDHQLGTRGQLRIVEGQLFTECQVVAQ